MSKFKGLKMAEKVESEDVEIEEEAEELETEEETEESEEEETEESEEESGEEEPEDDSVIVTIGEETPPQEEDDEIKKAPQWVRDQRKENRELKRELRRLKEEREALSKKETQAVKLGPRPKLEDDGIDFDVEKFDQKVDEWYIAKQKHDAEQARLKTEQEQIEAEWSQKLEKYAKAKNELKVSDFDEAEQVVIDTLTEDQQRMILQGADDSALVVYAIGRDPKVAQRFASIKNPVDFAVSIGRLEAKPEDVITMKRKAKTQPEKKVQGTGSKSGAMDSTLERLEREADKTGDRTKVVQYKRKLKQQAK
jgi:hypothetical protein